MKSKLLVFTTFGSLLLCLGMVQAASPRFDNWGEWQQKDVTTEAKPASETSTKATDKNSTDKTPTKDKAAEASIRVAAKATTTSTDTDQTTTLGPPTKGRRVVASSDEDRSTPTPLPQIMMSPAPEVMSKTSVQKAEVEEDKLSWWERWKRKRQGTPVTPIVIPDSHVYTVRLQEGDWTASGTRLECKLRQTIPRLGKVVFQQKIGTELEFKFILDRRFEQIHQARFESMPTNWGHQTHKRIMAIPASLQQSSITVPREGAIRLINELLEDMAPRMTYRMGPAESSDEVVVTLSSRSFVKNLQLFQDCISNLLPFQFDEVKESIVYFNYDSATLTAKARKALAKVAEYVLLDDGVKRIVIEGHTDSKGFRRYNQRLATRRAQAVEKFFLEQGITRSRLSLRSRALGEKKPKASNKSASGRAQNRRVHVSLFK